MHEIVFYIKPPRVPTLCLECLGEETQTVLDPVTSSVPAHADRVEAIAISSSDAR